MNIETKFDVGDKVYIVRLTKVVITKKCEACCGKGWVTLVDDHTYQCPACFGKGKFTWSGKTVYKVVGPVIIRQIRFTKVMSLMKTVEFDLRYLFYKKELRDIFFEQWQLFSDKSAAKEYCAYRNRCLL